MEPELIALATAGATTLVTQMTTDGWAQARSLLGRFFSRGGRAEDVETVEGELETTRGELAAARSAADHEMEAVLRGQWLVRIRDTLAADPESAEQLRRILDELKPSREAEGVRVNNAHNKMSGTVHGGTVIQVGALGRLHHGDTGSGDRTP
ncbi:hypothetical protein ACFYVL_24430 [Streptomyces sp. NPDC004111]|uniref:hypothetical protein n=1 Tax=Streptomyces sp. NPDC004111 TaxID=3364690 RepID=UPI00367AC32B